MPVKRGSLGRLVEVEGSIGAGTYYTWSNSIMNTFVIHIILIKVKKKLKEKNKSAYNPV